MVYRLLPFQNTARSCRLQLQADLKHNYQARGQQHCRNGRANQVFRGLKENQWDQLESTRYYPLRLFTSNFINYVPITYVTNLPVGEPCASRYSTTTQTSR